jgi:hypothetical protein
MRSQGEVLTIPMPGHSSPSADRESFQTNSLRLDELIQNHDVIFALTDSREARWLPTVMCSAHDKVSLSETAISCLLLTSSDAHQCSPGIRFLSCDETRAQCDPF